MRRGWGWQEKKSRKKKKDEANEAAFGEPKVRQLEGFLDSEGEVTQTNDQKV